MDNPKTISQGDLEELEQLVEQYPYFQIGHALIAKIKADNKTLDYRDKIHLAAINTADRNVLKSLIKDQIFNEEPTSDSIKNIEVESPVFSEEIKPAEEQANTETFAFTPDETKIEKDQPIEEKIDEELKEQKVENEVVEEKAASKSEDTIEKPTESKEKEEEEAIPLGNLNIRKSSDPDKEKVSITDNTKQEDPKDNLYKELEENLRSLQKRKAQSAPKPRATPAAKKETSARPKSSAAKTPAVSKTKTAPKTPASKSTTAATSKTTPASAKKTSVTKTTTTKKTTAKPQTGTTKKTTASAKTGVKKTVGKTTASKAKPASEKQTETSKKKLQKTVSKDENKEIKKKDKNSGTDKIRNKQTEIIEEFIKKEPTITKPKPVKGQGNVPQEDLSLKSIEIKEDLISENLAIIMEKQGKIQKAKDIYKKLIWKFPQKKAYFASRIEELERT